MYHKGEAFIKAVIKMVSTTACDRVPELMLRIFRAENVPEYQNCGMEMSLQRHTNFNLREIRNVKHFLKEKGDDFDSLDVWSYLTGRSIAASNGNLELLKQQIEDQKTIVQCGVCMTHEADTLFYPCQHLRVCFECSTALAKCPFCKQKKKGVILVHKALPLDFQICFPFTDIKMRILQTELQHFENTRMCISRICRKGSKIREAVYLPCGHFVHCQDCAIRQYHCPICKIKLLGHTLVFHY